MRLKAERILMKSTIPIPSSFLLIPFHRVVILHIPRWLCLRPFGQLYEVGDTSSIYLTKVIKRDIIISMKMKKGQALCEFYAGSADRL